MKSSANLLSFVEPVVKPRKVKLSASEKAARKLAEQIEAYEKDGGEVIHTARGDREWRKGGERHRLDGPAFESADNNDDDGWSWWKEGKLHREDGPAVYDGEGRYDWYQNGNEHREDGPAVEINYDGLESYEWYLMGKRHREDGPAFIDFDGTKEWWLHGKKHRENGPAVESTDGKQEWWLNGIEYADEEAFKRAKA